MPQALIQEALNGISQKSDLAFTQRVFENISVITIGKLNLLTNYNEYITILIDMHLI